MLFNKKFSDRITEYDYLQKVWAPLLEAILAVNEGLIRLKRYRFIANNSFN